MSRYARERTNIRSQKPDIHAGLTPGVPHVAKIPLRVAALARGRRAAGLFGAFRCEHNLTVTDHTAVDGLTCLLNPGRDRPGGNVRLSLPLATALSGRTLVMSQPLRGGGERLAIVAMLRD